MEMLTEMLKDKIRHSEAEVSQMDLVLRSNKVKRSLLFRSSANLAVSNRGMTFPN